MDPVVDRETAEGEFQRFAALAKINLQRYENDDSKEGFQNLKETFIQCVINGAIAVDDLGWPTIYTDCESLQEVTIQRKPGKRDDMAADGTKQPFEFEKKTVLKIASWCGKSSALLTKLESADFRRLEVVFELFRDYRD